jgi:hypothetical protein
MSAGRLCIRYNLGASTFLHRNRETLVGKDFNNRFRSGQNGETPGLGAGAAPMVTDPMSVGAAINVESRSMGKSSGGNGSRARSKIIKTFGRSCSDQ